MLASLALATLVLLGTAFSVFGASCVGQSCVDAGWGWMLWASALGVAIVSALWMRMAVRSASPLRRFLDANLAVIVAMALGVGLYGLLRSV